MKPHETQLSDPLPLRSPAQRNHDCLPALLVDSTTGRPPAVSGLPTGQSALGGGTPAQGTRPATSTVGAAHGLTLRAVGALALLIILVSAAVGDSALLDASIGWSTCVTSGVLLVLALVDYVRFLKGGRRD